MNSLTAELINLFSDKIKIVLIARLPCVVPVTMLVQ